jgi:hypothetical protein
MKEQIQKYARKHIKGGCYLKVTLGHRGLIRKNKIHFTLSICCVLSLAILDNQLNETERMRRKCHLL